MIWWFTVVVTLGVIFMLFDEGDTNKGLMMFYFIGINLVIILFILFGTIGLRFIVENIF